MSEMCSCICTVRAFWGRTSPEPIVMISCDHVVIRSQVRWFCTEPHWCHFKENTLCLCQWEVVAGGESGKLWKVILWFLACNCPKGHHVFTSVNVIVIQERKMFRCKKQVWNCSGCVTYRNSLSPRHLTNSWLPLTHCSFTVRPLWTCPRSDTGSDTDRNILMLVRWLIQQQIKYSFKHQQHFYHQLKSPLVKI